jgi:hypothetical protein
VTVISPQTATVSRVATSTVTAVLFAAAGATVKGRAIFNDSAAVLYVKFGATASSTDYTVQVAAGGYYELPVAVYGGVVHGILSTGTGSAQCTSW